MRPIVERAVWLSVDLPGQGDGEEELPSSQVMHNNKFPQSRCMLHDEMVMGAVLIHCTGQTASFADSLRDKLVNWKLKTIGMNPATESFLILHRFGYVSRSDVFSHERVWGGNATFSSIYVGSHWKLV
ncbi:unnamed protein product [Hydatigera taeniaeformis]|uniref:DELLA protein n=1 Tax=Hydatigena taeniaeformis TaxID=6205 RepID=A0A0R3WJZ1_HYDTA|nr:unnamed protein product [Hydatigera taeniaeformis]